MLEEILRWKELQRQLSGGQFFWGVGSVPGREKQIAFLRSVDRPKILFSEQLSEAKENYKNPSETKFWTHYRDQSGQERELPALSAVTSKAGADKHYAIICRSADPIQLKENIDFDIGLFGNFQGSSNIAYQQPAPIIEEKEGGRPKKLYRRGFWADLDRPYFVTLTRGRTLSQRESSKIRSAMKKPIGPVDFEQLVRELKSAS